jgi:hypothetical protein
MGMVFLNQKVKIHYWHSSMKTESENEQSEINLVGVQKVRWDKGGTALADNCTFLYGNANHHLEKTLCAHGNHICSS